MHNKYNFYVLYVEIWSSNLYHSIILLPQKLIVFMKQIEYGKLKVAFK
jgi:hypothetical protein